MDLVPDDQHLLADVFDTGPTDSAMRYESAAALPTIPVYVATGIGCIPNVALDNNSSFALRASQITVSPDGSNRVNDLAVVPARTRSAIEIVADPLVSAPWQLTGVADGIEGYVLEIVNLTGQTMTVVHNSGSSLAPNRLRCANAANLPLPSAAGGFSWVRLKYSATVGGWLVLEHAP